MLETNQISHWKFRVLDFFLSRSAVSSYIGTHCHYYKGSTSERLLCANSLMGSGPCKWMSTWAILGDVLRKVTSVSDSSDNRAPLIPVHPFISMHCSCYKLTNVNSPRPRGVDACWSCGMWISKRKKIMKLGLLAKECLCDSWVTNNLNLFASRYIGNLPITKVLEILFQMNLEYEFDILWLSDNKLRRNEGINGVDVFFMSFIW